MEVSSEFLESTMRVQVDKLTKDKGDYIMYVVELFKL